MAERTCDNCGKKKDVSGGKTCESGHFICKACVDSGYSLGGLMGSALRYCPLCKNPLK